MRIRLQLLLPLAVSLLIAAGFLAAAITVGDAVRMAQPGYRAEAAARLVVLWGVASLAAGALVAVVIARLVVGPLQRIREAAQRLEETETTPDADSPIAEIQDMVRGIARTAGELRARNAREMRERSELATVVDAVSEGIVQVDAAGRIVRVNRAGRALLRLPGDAVGRTVASMVRNAALRRILARSGSGSGRGAEAGEVVLDDRSLLVTSSPLQDGGAVVTFVDLTALRRLEEIRRDFVANASHELKTPLTSIRGYTETLLAGDLPEPDRRQFLDTIARNAERLQRIVDDLLDLSRLESGRWQPELEEVVVADVAASSWQAFGERARRRGVVCEIVSDGDVPALADRRALDQVFTNLYDNALRHTPADGRIRVAVHLRQDQAPSGGSGPRRHDSLRGSWVVVEVEDTGSGIPRDALPRIFERFYRVDPARSRSEGGTGLGLSIVRHMVESMGGVVTAESELGKGTTIQIWLPRSGAPA